MDKINGNTSNKQIQEDHGVVQRCKKHHTPES